VQTIEHSPIVQSRGTVGLHVIQTGIRTRDKKKKKGDVSNIRDKLKYTISSQSISNRSAEKQITPGNYAKSISVLARNPVVTKLLTQSRCMMHPILICSVVTDINAELKAVN
jgi:hypothetical protein